MSWLSRLADRLVLQPTRHPLQPEQLQRKLIGPAGSSLELWTEHIQRPAAAPHQRVLILKFPGTGGRAENATARPADVWSRLDSVLWTVNPYGYGGSSGQATLQRFPEMIDTILQAARDEHPQRRLVVVGNSLGTVSALATAARVPVAAVYLRNPVPIHQLISRRPRYAWTSFGLSRLVAEAIPRSIDAVHNAARTEAPALVLMSLQDRLVPPDYQRLILDPYAGATQVLGLAGADHHDPVPADQLDDWQRGLLWLEEQICLQTADR